MSVLSSITGRLPNLLETFQGTWKVEYKIKTKSGEQSLGWLDDWNILSSNAKDLLVKAGQTYGLFPDQWKILDFTSFVDMQEIDDTSITSHPIEGGSFRSVNKVKKPKEVKVTLAKAGIGYGIEDSLDEVKKLLPLARYSVKQGIKPKLKSIPMEFRVITPFNEIDNLNLIRLDYGFKQENGRNMLLMYLTFQEIIEKSGVTKKVAKNPTDYGKENIGRLSPQPTGNILNLSPAFNIPSGL